MNNKTKAQKIDLFSVIMMIVGVVIGSGIFFKSNYILISTHGSILLGIFAFTIAAISIIFGSLTISQLASRTDEPGGVISYATNEINSFAGCIIGWYHFFLLYSASIGVVSWISTMYISMVFNLDLSLNMRLLVALFEIIFFFMINLFVSEIATIFQTSAAIIKLIPLILIAILGMIFGDISNFSVSNSLQINNQMSWISAITPIAFTYEGWIIVTSITHKIKNPKKNLPIALIIAPLLILSVYLCYFIGISIYIGPDEMMKMGDSHMLYAANNLFGPFGGKIAITAVLISVLGNINGKVMGIIQLPYSLSLRGMFPKSNLFSKVNDKFGAPIYSGIVAFISASLWIFINYIDKKYKLLGNTDVSEVIIVVNYLLYIMLYLKVIQLKRNKEIKSIFLGYISPIMPTIGSVIILFGGLQNPKFIYVFIICGFVILTAILFWYFKRKHI